MGAGSARGCLRAALLLVLVFVLVGLARPRIRPPPCAAGGRHGPEESDAWEPGSGAIPETIFTYWSGPPDELAEKCIDRMHRLHPDWDLVRLEEMEVEECEGLDRLESLANRSDWVRLCALEEYGGVYLDASVACVGPVEEWVDLDLGEVQGFSGFWGEGTLETWALAAPPRHPLIRAWRDELRRAMALGFNEYKKQAPAAARRYGPTMRLPYLTVYACYLVASEQTGLRARTRPSPDGPYRYMHEWGWTPLGVRALVQERMPPRPPPLIKVGRYQRKWLRRFRAVEGSYWEHLGLCDDAKPRRAAHDVYDFFAGLLGAWLCLGTDVAAWCVQTAATPAARE